MIVWGAMAIPVLVAVVLLLFFQHKTVWWEFIIPLVVSVVLIAGTKACVTKVNTTDTEYWGGIAQRAEYYEDWNEYIHQTCTRTVSCGENCTTTETYDCSYVSYHAAYWQVVDDNGLAVRISQAQYRKLVAQFGGDKFLELHRNYHTDDGDKYLATWDGRDETLEPVVTVHRYENRVQASTSLFNFQPVSQRDKVAYGLFDYPEVNGYSQTCILGRGDATQAQAEKALAMANAKLGRAKQAKIFVLVFRNQPLQAGMLQENYWKRGNKNEMIVAIGVDDADHIQWAHPFSWTEVEELKIELRDEISRLGQLQLTQVVDLTTKLMAEKWQRKRFRDFSYLTVEPSGRAVALVYLITLLVNLGLSAWIIFNQFQEERVRSWR